MTTTLTPSTDSRSGPTLACLTGAIVLREGARAVGSTFARQWDPAAPPPPPPEPTPSSLRALPALATPSAPASPAAALAATPLAPAHGPSRRSRREITSGRTRSLPWSQVGAFALGAALASLAGVGIDHGSLGIAALASAVAGGITLAAALAQAHADTHARGEVQRKMRRRRGKPRA